MAYAVLVSLEETIDQILNQDRYTTSPQQKHLVISLLKHVISLQNFLQDFPNKACSLEGRMRDVATAAEDIIEYFMLDQILSPNAPDSHMIEHELNEVVEKMDSLAAEVVEMKNTILSEEEKASDSSSIASSSSRVGKIEMVGFDDELIKIKDRLTGGWSKLQFISIVGMGGIGKTTLAKTAYDDQFIQDHFHIRAWVTISQDYRARDILSSLLESIKEFDPLRRNHREEHMAEEFAEDASKQETSETESIEEMKERVYKILKWRRYVVVMDDMWSRNVLDDVRMLFPDDDNGSRVMLTTRLSDVASYADSSAPPYEMHLMDEDQSWNLLRQKLEIPPALEIIGKEIARSCKGLPLAIVVIAGVLSTASKTPASCLKNLRHVTTKFLSIKNLGMRSITCFDDSEFEGPLENVRLLRLLHVRMFKVTLLIAIRCYEDISSNIKG